LFRLSSVSIAQAVSPGLRAALKILPVFVLVLPGLIAKVSIPTP
jgi:hypothetical protein